MVDLLNGLLSSIEQNRAPKEERERRRGKHKNARRHTMWHIAQISRDSGGVNIVWSHQLGLDSTVLSLALYASSCGTLDVPESKQKKTTNRIQNVKIIQMVRAHTHTHPSTHTSMRMRTECTCGIEKYKKMNNSRSFGTFPRLFLRFWILRHFTFGFGHFFCISSLFSPVCVWSHSYLWLK